MIVDGFAHESSQVQDLLFSSSKAPCYSLREIEEAVSNFKTQLASVTKWERGGFMKTAIGLYETTYTNTHTHAVESDASIYPQYWRSTFAFNRRQHLRNERYANMHAE